jgi:hypothetical protein
MRTLSKILLAGSIFLAGCNFPKSRAVLTGERFQKAEWIEVPYNGRIYSGYTEEDIFHGETNWASYKREVAKRNNFKITQDGKDRIVGVKGNSILLPDLDKNGTVMAQGRMYAIDTYRKELQADKEDRSHQFR